MGKMIKKMNNEKALTKEELAFMKLVLIGIEEEFDTLNAMYQKKAHDKYYFEKSKKLGENLKKYQKRLKQGLKVNKKLEKRNCKC